MGHDNKKTSPTSRVEFFVSCSSLILLFASCANMGSPDGGWYDDTPPRVIASTPTDKGTGVKDRKIKIMFNEYIQVENATSNVVISPPQLEMPDIKTAGKSIVIELKDTLRDSTTYTIDFADAISDNNESNPMGNYTFSFSTGDRIDTFEVAGNVLEASNLEPVKSILVGLYEDLSDTAFTTHPMLRVARTDSRGHFIIRGVAPGNYRIYALNDADGDYVYNQMSEMIAFSHDIITPYCGPDTKQDTIWRDSLHIDSIALVPYTHFYPDDLTLLAFTPEQTNRYLIKTERQDHRKLSFYFSYGHEEVPQIKGLNFDSSTAFIVETSEKKDTVHYWLSDTLLANQDTLSIEIRYMATDTLGMLAENIDTLDMTPKTPYEKRLKEASKEYEDWMKEQEKKKKKGQPYDSIKAPKPLTPNIIVPNNMSPDREIIIEMPTPLVRLDTAAVHLYVLIDTLWYNARFELEPMVDNIRRYRFLAEWRPDVEYSLEIDSAALEDTYGQVSDAVKKGIRVQSMDNFSTLFVELKGIKDTCLVVQMLNSSGKLYRETRPVDGTAEFYYVTPGMYYLCAYSDTNGNGVWDTGDYYSDLQAERVYYDPKKVECKAKWDVTHQWNVTATPVVKQKPLEITTQKPDKAKTVKNRNAERAKSLGIMYDPTMNK